MEIVKKQEKISYEELEKNYNSLIERVNGLQNQLSQVMNMNNTLHWLFRAMDHADKFNPEFVKTISKHLENILTPPKEEDKNKAE